MARTSVLEGIDVRYLQKDGYNLVFFRPLSQTSVAKTKRDQSVASAARAFMVGLHKAAAVLEHHAARHNGDLPMPSVVDAGGGSCSYDDWGDLTCDGGSGGRGGDGDSGSGGNGGNDSGEDTGCSDCSYPDDADPAQAPDQGSVPATNANQPCAVVDGTTICEMTGPRPLPIPVPTAPPPVGTIPPVGGIPPIEQLPSGQTPWFPQSWCDWFPVLCSAGQEPRDNDRGPNGDTSGKTQAELDEICVNINKVEIDVCATRFSPSKLPRDFAVCRDNANQRMYACFRTASQLTDNGAHPAP